MPSAFLFYSQSIMILLSATSLKVIVGSWFSHAHRQRRKEETVFYSLDGCGQVYHSRACVHLGKIPTEARKLSDGFNYVKNCLKFRITPLQTWKKVFTWFLFFYITLCQ